MFRAGHFSSSKLPHYVRGSGLLSITCFLGPIRLNFSNGISIGYAVFAGLTIVGDRPTDRPRYSVCSSGPLLANTATWPNHNVSKIYFSKNL